MKRLILFFLSALFVMATPLIAEDETTTHAVTLPKPEVLPIEERTDLFFSEFFNMLSSLGIILLILLLITWALRRATHARMEQLNVTSNIKVIERRVLGPKSTIYVMDIYGTRLILGETPAGFVRLGELTPDATAFSRILQGKAQEKPNP